MKRSKLLKRICVLFLITFLPITLCSAFLFTHKNTELKDETLQNTLTKSIHIADTIDNYIWRIYKQTYSILSNSDIIRLSILNPVMDNYDKYQTVKRMKQSIANITYSTDLIYNIKVYICNQNIAYNSNQTAYGNIEILSDNTIQSRYNLNADSTKNIFYIDNKLILLLQSDSDINPIMVEAEISLQQLKSELNLHGGLTNSSYIFNYSNGSCILDNITDEELYNSAISTQYKDGISLFDIDGVTYYGFLTNLKHIDATYIQIIPASEIFQSVNFTYTYLICFISIIITCMLLFFIGSTYLIHKPMKNLIVAFEKAATGDFSVRIADAPDNEFSYLYTGFNNMIENQSTLIDETYRQRLLLQKADLKQLQTQINPHFLYNSFFMLQRMIKKNRQEDSIQMASALGTYFKYITKTHSDFVFLKDEYLHAKIYSDIQSLRFEGRISTVFGELPSAYENLKIPRLILQPIIENAYNYGLENKYEDGLLVISFTAHQKGLYIIIEDNGEDLTDQKLIQLKESLKMPDNTVISTEITGLINIFQRIHYFYQNDSNLTLSRSELGGLKVVLFLSKENEGEAL